MMIKQLLAHQELFFMLSWIFLIAGCASKSSFKNDMGVFIGQPIAHVELLVGAPERKQRMENGNYASHYKLHDYKDCTVFYEVDDNTGFVHKWWHQGVCPR